MEIHTNFLADLQLGEPVEYSLIEQICEWERQEYGDGKHRTPDQFYPCVRKNRRGFLVSLVGDRLVGYADLWQLEKSFYAALRIGTVDEEALAEEHVLAASEVQTRCWYIGSIITSPALRSANPVVAAFLFAEICNMLPDFFRQSSHIPCVVLGVGSSSFGKKLLRRWSFTPVEADKNAIDLRPRFERRLDSIADASCFHLGRQQPRVRRLSL